MKYAEPELYLVRNESVGNLRKAVFPFFDHGEIALVVVIMISVSFTVMLVGLPNKWLIPMGSYLGMLIVGWHMVPSFVELPEIGRSVVIEALNQIGLKETSPGVFSPDLPKFLLWPRSKVVITGDQNVTLYGPEGLLMPIADKLNYGFKRS